MAVCIIDLREMDASTFV